MDYSDLNTILERLIELGEDRSELEYWKDIFGDLDPERQAQIYATFETELKKLSAIQRR